MTCKVVFGILYFKNVIDNYITACINVSYLTQKVRVHEIECMSLLFQGQQRKLIF